MPKVAVALSGGVDSSVSALLLKNAGYDIFGVTMRLNQDCFNEQMMVDAKYVCDKLSIKHHIVDFREDFNKKVVDYFRVSYLKGLTPNPCAVCNKLIKFGLLLDKVREMGADFLATGHYARIEKNNGQQGYGLFSAVDSQKDQSYFLFGLNKVDLGSIMFPLGNMTKSEVKEIADNFGYQNAYKEESQDICFLNGKKYNDLINPEPMIGEILDKHENVLGFHNGFWNFTVGQRKGIMVSNNHPLYVLSIDADKNSITVGRREELEYLDFCVTDLNWLIDLSDLPKEVEVKTRYRQQSCPAKIQLDGESVRVSLVSSGFALSLGQCCVFYNQRQVIGGGVISHAIERKKS